MKEFFKKHYKKCILACALATVMATSAIMIPIFIGNAAQKAAEKQKAKIDRLVDFTVEVESSRPRVLQLSDTQIQDGAQIREGDLGDPDILSIEKVNQACYQYIETAIEKSQPDLILVTGDIVYGKYDDNGSVFKGLVDYIDSFEIPWAPVFGNHEAESKMGADWQCEQLENAEHCLFKQGDVSGNGNYTVGLIHNDELIRVYFMMDTHGNYAASEASKTGKNPTYSANGMQQDQLNWFAAKADKIKKTSPNTKLSMAFHIPLAVFNDAMIPYGAPEITDYTALPEGASTFAVNIDTFDGLKNNEDDFGYLGCLTTSNWDRDKTAWELIKSKGVDSIYVGHEHVNDCNVTYEGVRLIYGLKTGLYDHVNYVKKDGSIIKSYSWGAGKPIVGGKLTVLSADGSFDNCYNLYH